MLKHGSEERSFFFFFWNTSCEKKPEWLNSELGVPFGLFVIWLIHSQRQGRWLWSYGCTKTQLAVISMCFQRISWMSDLEMHMLSKSGRVRQSESPEAQDSPLSAPDLLLCSCTFWGVQHIHPLFWLWECLRDSLQSHGERYKQICYPGCFCLEM